MQASKVRSSGSGIWLIIIILIIAFVSPAVYACYRYPAPHTPKPAPWQELTPPTSYPYTLIRSFNFSCSTNFRLDPAAFGTAAGRDLNIPMAPMTYSSKVYTYFGPNKIGSFQLLNGGGIRMEPGYNLLTSISTRHELWRWLWGNDYDHHLVNYWYSSPHRTHQAYSPGGCTSWTSGNPPRTYSYCWPGYWYTVVDCYNHYEVYYWQRNRNLVRGPYRVDRFSYERTKIYEPDETGKLLAKSGFKPAGEGARDADAGPISRNYSERLSGLGDKEKKILCLFESIYTTWPEGWGYSAPAQRDQRSEMARVHPKPAISPTWRVDVSGVWYPTIGDTKVNIRFKWNRDLLNNSPSKPSHREKYYIEYGKIFDGMIKMKDVIKMLANLGFGQVDVPVYMALEGPEPKLYLVTTPSIIGGRRIAPMPYRAIDESNWLSGAGVIPGITLHPITQAQQRGYMRECKVDSKGNPVFVNGKPVGEDRIKYVFTKIFDYNADDKVDNDDKRKFEAAFPYADFDENGKIDSSDCSSVWKHAFENFPNAFNELASQIRARFAANPALLTSRSASALAGPVVIPEYYASTGATNRYVQIGWRGNAFAGEFYVQPIPGASSKSFKFAPAVMTYNTSSDPGVTGENFLMMLGPKERPSLSELYKKTTMNYPDGSLLGRLKKLTVSVYPKGCFYNKVMISTSACHDIGDPWGIGQLESVESGHMGNLFIKGDADGNGYFDKNDLALWDKIKTQDGFLLSTVYQHKIGMAPGKAVQTDNDKTFRIIAGGKFSVYPPDGVTDFVHKESYNYKFINPTIWAYDAIEGNQFSLGRRFALESGSSDPEKPKEPPQPPTQVRYLPTSIIGPNDIPEDMPQTWSLSGAEMVIIKPDTWSQTWRISPEVPGGTGTGAGTSFSYEFLQAGKYTIVHTVNYTQRIVTPVTDGLGIIVYYAATDIPQTRVLTYDVCVYDHTPADFDDPKLTLNGPGNITTYAPQWGVDAADLRKRDFPGSFKAYPETRTTDVRAVGIPVMTNNDWHYLRATVNGKEHLDQNFDLVNADSKRHNYRAKLELKFARNVNETSDLNEANLAGAGHLEAFSGILLDKPISMNVEVKRHQPGGGVENWRSFTYTPDRDAQGNLEIDKSAMTTYLVRVGSRYLELKTVSFTSEYSWELPVPTFPNEGYETIVTLVCKRRDYYLDHPSQDAANKARFGADYSGLVRNNDGVIRYIDRDMTSVWRRKAFTVDITPPNIPKFMEFNGSEMAAIVNNTIYGNSGDQTKYLVGIEDNHPGFGPNDGLKNGGTRRSWYPRLWFQKIDGAAGRFTLEPQNGYEFPMILPAIKDKLSTAADGDLSPDIDKFNLERVDGHRLALVGPTDKEKFGTPAHREMTIQHQFSNYIAGKIKYLIEIEDSSRNYTRLEGYFNVTDNKRPNLDLRLATAKYKPLPDDGSLKLMSDIAKDTPLGPTAQPFGALLWADSDLKERVKGSKAGLFSDWRHAYDPDQKFVSGSFSSSFSLPGYNYDRKASLNSGSNLVITEKNISRRDDPVIKLADTDIKAAFNAANPGAPGFAEDELIVFDLSVRDNILFWQNDSDAPFGAIVGGNNFRSIAAKFREDVIDEHGVKYFKEFDLTPVKSMSDPSPLRLLNDDGTPLSYVFRVGNADVKTGLKNKGGNLSGTNSFSLKVIDLQGNSRDLEIDFPIIPSRFQIRVLESTTEAGREGM